MRTSYRAMLALAFSLPSAALAQRTPLIIDRDRLDRAPVAPPRPHAANPVEGAGRAMTDTAGAPGTALSTVKITGSSLQGQVFDQVWRPFVGKPLDIATINEVAAAIGAIYADSDAALYTIVVPNQDFAGGVLRVRVVEGHISGVIIDDDKGKYKSALVSKYARRLTLEKPLRKATLERYLSLIRDIPGLTADAVFLTSPEPDAVRLGLRLREKKFVPALSADNRGTVSLGQFQYQAQATANGLFRQGDQTVLTAATSGDFKRYRYISASHGAAIGDDGTRITANIGYLKTRPRNSAIVGDATLAGLQLSHPLVRSYKRNLYATLAFDGIDSDNAAFGTLIAREHSRAGRAALAWSQVGTRDVTSASLTVSRGLNVLSANAPGDFVDLTFTKANGRVTYDRSIGKAVALHLKAAGQHSRDRMPSVETFTLGGDDFGRAFEYSSALGDKGIAGSAELAWMPQRGLPTLLKGSTLYTFVDGGSVRLNPRGAFPGQTYTLASAGAGVKVGLGPKGWIGLEQAKSLETPAGIDGGWKTIISWRLSLR